MTTYSIKTTLKSEDIANLITSAFEGGSNYWIGSADILSPSRDELKKLVTSESYINFYCHKELYDLKNFEIEIIEDLPICGGHDGKHILTPALIQRGLDALAEKYPARLAEVVSETDDAETADVFLQCCLFGEVVYG